MIDYPFISLENTQAHRLFEQKTPEDFAGSTVLDFKDAGFGVLNDGVVTVSGRAVSGGYLVTTDAALSVGDSICIPECNAMVKIASLRKNDDGSYTVTADDSASLMDFYQFLRVSETVDAGETMGDDSSPMFAADFSYGDTFDLKRFSKHLEYRAATADLTAGVSVTYSINRDSKTLGEDYVECDLSVSVDGSVNYMVSKGITLEHTFDLPEYNIPTSVFGLTIPVRMGIPLKFTAEASLEIETSFDLSAGIRYNTKSDVTPHRDGNFHAKYSTEGKLTGSAGVRMDIGLSFLRVLDAFVGAEVGGEFTATTNPIDIDVENNEIEKMHTCMLCFDVAVDRYVDLYAHLGCKLPFNIDFEFNHTWPVVKERVYDGYLSLINPPFSLFEGKVSSGEGPCPNVKYKTKISVIDKDNNPVPDAQYKITGTTVTGSPAQTLTGIGSHAESLYPGSYTVEAEYEGLKGSRDFTVSGYAQSVTVKVRDDQDLGIPIDAEHFPDDYFREYVRQFDTDKDNYLYDDEIYEVKIIEVSGKYGADENNYIIVESMNTDLHSLEGIKYFYNLVLLDCDASALESLDVSGLTNLRFLSCTDVPCLEYLYARGCTGLQEVIAISKCPNLRKVDVSGCTSLVELAGIGQPVLDPNTGEPDFDNIDTKVGSIIASGCTSLESLWFHLIPDLSYLDLRGCEKLERIDCTVCGLSSLDVRGFTNLKRLDCSDNWLTDLDLEGCSGLEELYCNSNKISSLNLEPCPGLKVVTCENTIISSLDIRPLYSSEPFIGLNYGKEVILRNDQKPHIGQYEFGKFEDAQKAYRFVYG